RPRQDPLHVRLVPDVAGDRQHFGTARADLGRGPFERLGPAGDDRQPGPLGRHPIGDAPPDAATRAGHDHYLAFEHLPGHLLVSLPARLELPGSLNLTAYPRKLAVSTGPWDRGRP